jgi:hypothetical protein
LLNSNSCLDPIDTITVTHTEYYEARSNDTLTRTPRFGYIAAYLVEVVLSLLKLGSSWRRIPFTVSVSQSLSIQEQQFVAAFTA